MKRIFKLNSALFSALMLSLCLLPASLSCSRAEPQILYGFMELVYYPGTAAPIERYSFFVLPEDNDGVENLSELLLYHDREGLHWTFTSEDWIQYEDDETIWIGSRNIAMIADDPLPRGQYRAVLINRGGERGERSFSFDGPAEPIHPFPGFSADEGMYTLDSQYPVNTLLCYDLQGNVVQTINLIETEGSLRDLRITGNARTAALWAEDPEYRVSALTEAVPIR